MAEDYSRGLVRYTSRDYESLRQEFFDLVPKLTDLWKPEADSDPGVVLGDWLASVGSVLGVNLDILATEVNPATMSQRKSAEKILGLIGYTLGFYVGAVTEVTIKNELDTAIEMDFGFNGANWATLNAYTDITNNTRTITYNILPRTNGYGATDTRSIREITTTNVDVFASSDKVTLEPGESVTRVAAEGTLRSYQVSVSEVKQNNYVITLPSQHVDPSKVWLMAKANSTDDTFLNTQWIQCETVSGFVTPEPRFAVTYDNYSNAQVTVSSYLNQLDNYENNYLVVYWLDVSGVIGCVGEDVLTNLLFAVDQPMEIATDSGDVSISNLSNTVELPHTYTVTGDSPETAHEAYLNSRNYINTWDSLVTLPDYNRFLNREAGIDCGVVIDCQKALEINMAIYNDDELTEDQKRKMYITNYDFPAGANDIDWQSALDLGFDPTDPNKFVFAANFKRYTAMCFAVHNDFQPSSYGRGSTALAQTKNTTNFVRYKPPQQVIEGVLADYRPLQSLSVDVQFGYARVFKFYVVGTIYTKKPVSEDVAYGLVLKAKEALALYFAPSNRQFGVKPTLTEVVDVIERCDDNIKYFDAGSNNSDCIRFDECDPDYWNYLGIGHYSDYTKSTTIRVSPSCIVEE